MDHEPTDFELVETMLTGWEPPEPVDCAPARFALKRIHERQERQTLAITQALGWFYDPDENALTQFERIGDWFYRETGHLRPGKDDRLEDTNSPENRKRFQEWCASKSREALFALRESLKP